MARKPIEIPIASDTRAFSKAVDKGVIDPLEDAQQALQDVAKTGDKTGDSLIDDMRDAQRATEQLNKAVEDGTKTSFRKMAANVDEGTSKASESMAEVKNEALQNASETFSSFDGSATSFADGIQGTFGGLIGGLSTVNPALAGIAGAGAAAFGLVMSKIERAKEKTTEYRNRVAELTGKLIEAGNKGSDSVEDITSAMKELATETEKGKRTLEEIAQQAYDTGQDVDVLAGAFAGNTEALQASIDLTKKKIEVDQGYIDANNSWTNRFVEDYQRRVDANKDLLEDLEEQKTLLDDARRAADLYAEAGGPELERRAELVKGINDAYDDAAGAVDDFIDAESGLFDVDKYITAMNKREQALKDYQENLAKAELPAEVITFLNQQGTDAAAAMLQGYTDASPKQKRELVRIWSEAGEEASGAIDDKISAAVDKAYTATVDVDINSKSFENGLTALTEKQRTVKVQAEFVTRDGRPVF